VTRSWRLLAIVAVLASIAAWGVSPPAVSAQSGTVVIELDFETATGEPPPGGAAVLDLNTGIEYRNDGVSSGDSIEVDAVAGVASQLRIRRTDLQPGAVNCEGAQEAASVAGSRGVIVAITPGSDRVVCTITLLDGLPLTGPSTVLAMMGVSVLGLGALVVAISRFARD